jgi:hypothetical protein
VTGPAGADGHVRSLARRLTKRLRRDSLLGAGALAAIFVSAAVTVLEVLGRFFYLPLLRPLEVLAAAAGLAAATVVHFRSRPGDAAWLDAADATSGEPGVFSAAAAAGSGRLGPLVASRADSAAALLLAGPRQRRPLAPTVRLAIFAVLVGAVSMSLPGLKACNDDLALRLTQPLLADELRALRDEALAARSSDAAMLDQAATSLAGKPLSPSAAEDLARKLREAARGSRSRAQVLAEALAKPELLRDLAQALRHEDPAAVARAIEELALDAQRLDPRSQQALESAAALLNLAAAEPDPLLKSALADAGEALSGRSGSGASEGLRRLATPLQRMLRHSDSIRDVAVLLESAAAQDREGAEIVSVPGRPLPGAAPAGAPGALPELSDYRSLVRPGTADEAVLRRYFAVP